MADVGIDPYADLGADAFVGAEQGEVAVSGGARDEADEADFVEVAEAGDHAAAKGVPVGESFGEEAVPEAG